MARFGVAVLLGLLLAGSARAQAPVREFESPMPAPVAPPGPEDTQGAVMESAAPEFLSPNSGDDWRFWASADFALAWLKGKPLPALVTSSPPGTPITNAGLSSVTGTSFPSVLIGDTLVGAGSRPMGRLDFGYWFNQDRSLGVAAGFFITGATGADFFASSNGSTILARPFLDVSNNDKASSVLVAYPGTSAGSVSVYAGSQTFWGANVDLRETFLSESWIRLESLIGYRYLHYGESLLMGQSVSAVGPAFVKGTTIASNDSFQTANDFNGCEFGFNTQIIRDRWSLDILTKLAVGNLHREVSINGSTVTTVPPTATTGVGGVYALPSNIGNHFTDNTEVAPEVGLNLCYHVFSNLDVRLGYTFVYLQGIARAADQVDFHVNPNQFPPAAGTSLFPAFSNVKSDIWIQSLNFGVEFRF